MGQSDDNDGVSETPILLPFWNIDHDHPGFDQDAMSYRLAPQGTTFNLQYPIMTQLPHIDLPIGKKGQATAEGLLDTGGACTMGDIL